MIHNCTPEMLCVYYLVIVVIQIRICALKLHHLDSGDPFFLSLRH